MSNPTPSGGTTNALLGTDPNLTYGSWLQIANGNTGITGSLQTVYDGAGNASALQLSTATVNVTAFTINGSSISLGGAITTGGAVTFSGAFATTITVTALTAVTLPTSGTLYGTATGSITSLQLKTSLSDETGSGAAVFATSPTLVTPILGIPTSGTLTNCTGLPISTGVSGLGTGVATFLATPSSANLAAALTDETGTGAAVFANTPTLVTPVLGAATATTINKVTITAPASGSTLTIQNGFTLTVSGSATISTTPITRVVRQVFASGGIYTPTSGMVFADLHCIGGGAGGGGCAQSSASQADSGGGGGSGGYSFVRVTAAQVGASQTVTIGAAANGGTAGNNNGTAGNDTSIGTLCVAKGGGAGGGAAANGTGAAGTGGIAGTGDIASVGSAGTPGCACAINTVSLLAGAGGRGPLGANAVPQVFANNTGGATGNNAPANSGAGGNGGSSNNASAAAAGGNGGSGYAWVLEYIAA